MNVVLLAGAAALVVDTDGQVPAPSTPCFDVTTFGAVGDGVTDDTAAFIAAVAAAGPRGDCVRVPPVRAGAGAGYVLSSTVTLTNGVHLVGSLAGYAPPDSCYTSNSTGGSRILARPKPSTYNATAGTGAPLIHLAGTGCAVRGLYINYDQMPFPTDRDLFDAQGAYAYASFDDARRRFVAEHVPPVGPAIYVTSGVRVEIADVVGALFTWLVYFGGTGHGQSHVRRVQGWGYNALVTVEAATDVMSFDTLRMIINSAPYCLGARPAACDVPGAAVAGANRCLGNFTAVPAVVALRPSNVALWLGRADGYTARDLFAFGVHTAVRLGVAPPPVDPAADPYGGALALRNPVTGVFAADADAKKPSGVPGVPSPATGPWGTVAQLMADQVVLGVHLVWPNQLTNRFDGVQLHPSFWRRGDLLPGALAGSGTLLTAVGREAALLMEPTHSNANNGGAPATTMLSSMVVASFTDVRNFGDAACSLGGSNGRAFALLGDGLVDARGFAMNNERNGDTHLWARANGSTAQLRVTGVTLNFAFADDVRV
eukprot:g2641.t1